THRGPLDLRIRMDGDGRTVWVEVGGGARPPAGGIVVRTPLDLPVRKAFVNQYPAEVRDGREVVIRRLPAVIELVH
ncbi:MAG TPA: hypothetical protein VEA99_05470, partial [Gemmatimonadaceae bacterium]|nr:hypothetical protein [Gemmatimonadaceae bacterium]